MSENRYPYEEWEDVTRNQPTLSSLDEPPTLSGLTSPVPALSTVLEQDNDLTTNAGTGKPPIGQRIVVSGRVLDENGAPVPDVLIEIWQANAAGKYVHEDDNVDAPIDPNFTGVGRCIRQRGRIPVSDGPSRSVSLEGRYESVAAGAHPLVGSSSSEHVPGGDPDVL